MVEDDMTQNFTPNPEFVIYTGPMFGGKTSRMLSALDRAKYQSKRILAFKPKMDYRYDSEEIVTHSGHRWKAHCVSSGEEILSLSNDADIVAVDEAFMIDDVADALLDLFRTGKNIYISSIQLSARGEPFEEIQKMFPWATRIEVCPAVCPVSGKDAYYTVAKVDGLNEIDIGGTEKYEPRCHEHAGFLGA
jgi:thymidine kinase